MKEKILRINTARREIQEEAVPQTWQHLGGAGPAPDDILAELAEPIGMTDYEVITKSAKEVSTVYPLSVSHPVQT